MDTLTVTVNGLRLTAEQVDAAAAELKRKRALEVERTSREVHYSEGYMCIPRAVVLEMADALRTHKSERNYGCITPRGSVCYNVTREGKPRVAVQPEGAV